MIGTLARKRTNLTALAVLAALAVALFAVINIASAAPALVVSIDDSDNIVDAGGSNIVSFAVTGDDAGATASTYTVNFIVAGNGIVFNRDTTMETYATRSAQDVVGETDAAAATKLGTVLYPPNAAGEYTISVRATDTDGDILDGTLTITVGEAGDAIGAVSVSLGKVAHDTAKNAKTDSATTSAGEVASSYDTCTDADGSGPSDASDAGCIAVTVSVLNSLGEPANASDITGIHVFAPLATIYSADTPTEDGEGGTLNIGETFTITNGVGVQQGESVGATEKFYIAKGTAGVVNVSAIILGAGNATSEVLTLTFTGSASAITLGDPSSPLSKSGTKYEAVGSTTEGVDQNTDGDFTDTDDTPPVPAEEVPSVGVANIEVNATDKSGNPAPLTPDESVTVEVTDADGNVVETIDDNQRSKPNTLTLIVEMVGTDAAPGTYTVTMTLGELDEQTAEIVVAGNVANIDVAVSESTVALGDIITATATVTDADGNLQPDADTVMFQAVGSLKLTGLGTGGNATGQAAGTLDDGVATARFVVVDGSGTATIIASLDNVDGVTSVSTEAAAGAPEEVSLDCLSATNGFATYTCDMDSSASELFGLVSGRGATAVHLWNGSDWVRYSVVDGAMVPGSSDFTVTDNDILYISN